MGLEWSRRGHCGVCPSTSRLGATGPARPSAPLAVMNSTPTDDALIARLLDLSPFPIVVSRLKDHVVLAINDATATLFRGPKEAAVGRHVPDYYVNPAQREQLADLIRREGRVDRFRTHLRRDDGTTFWTFSSAR